MSVVTRLLAIIAIII